MASSGGVWYLILAMTDESFKIPQKTILKQQGNYSAYMNC